VLDPQRLEHLRREADDQAPIEKGDRRPARPAARGQGLYPLDQLVDLEPEALQRQRLAGDAKAFGVIPDPLVGVHEAKGAVLAVAPGRPVRVLEPGDLHRGDWEGIILGWLDLAPVDGDYRHAIQPPRRPFARRAVVGEMLREGHDQPLRAIPLLAG